MLKNSANDSARRVASRVRLRAPGLGFAFLVLLCVPGAGAGANISKESIEYRGRLRWSIPEDGPDLLRDIVGAVGSKHPLDGRRVYLFGHSAGANSALPLGLRGEEDERATAEADSKSKSEPAGESKTRRAEGGAPASEDEEVVRVSTSLVSVPVTVADADGRYVTDMRRAEFKVFEDGVEQQVAFFEPVEKPVTVALVLDVSDSTKFRLKDIQDAAVAFLERLRPDDRVMLVAFDRRVRLLSEATSDHAKLVEAIQSLQPGTGTSLFNALDMVIRQRLDAVRGRKAIVLFSDGQDTTSAGATYESNIENVEEFGGAVYTVRFDTSDSAARNALALGGVAISSSRLSRRSAADLGAAYLYEMALRTGARALHADTGQNLKEAFGKIADELRRQYTLSYYPARPSAPGQRRKIKVRVTREKVSVRSRRTYVSGRGAGD